MWMAKLIYKVYTDVGLHTQFMIRYFTVLDTGASSYSVVETVLPPKLRAQIKTHGTTDISDTNNHPLKTVGAIALVVRFGKVMVNLEYIVCKSLVVPVIMAWDYFDRFFKSVQPRLKQVKLEDGTVVPIVLQPLKRAPKRQVPLLLAQEASPATRESTKLQVASESVILSES